MNGAITEPLLNITRPPIIAITAMTGNSQSFFRARRNAHNSITKAMTTPLETIAAAHVAHGAAATDRS
jgi:hypothetical protein